MSAAAKNRADVPPRSVVISLSDFCNIRCTYCFEAKSSTTLYDHPLCEQTLGAIAHVLACGDPREDVYISFYGGEPLAHFALLQRTVAYFRQTLAERRIHFSIATNGTLLNEARLAYLVDERFSVQISLDGSPTITDVHRRSRSGGGISQKLEFVVSHVRQLPKASARMTVTPTIIDSFADSIRYLIDVGFDDPTRRVMFDFDLTATWSSDALDSLDKQATRIIEMLIAHYESGGRAFVEPLHRVLLASKHTSEYCGAACSALHVTPTGEFYPCNRLTSSHNAQHASLSLGRGTPDLTRVEQVRKIIRVPIQPRSGCATCHARSYCAQVCPARVFSSSGAFNVISDTYCRITRAVATIGQGIRSGLRPENRVALEATYGLRSVFGSGPLFPPATLLSVPTDALGS